MNWSFDEAYVLFLRAAIILGLGGLMVIVLASVLKEYEQIRKWGYRVGLGMLAFLAFISFLFFIFWAIPNWANDFDNAVKDKVRSGLTP